MNLGKVKKTHTLPRPTPVVISAKQPAEQPIPAPNWPAPKPAEQPIPATNWPVRTPVSVPVR